MTSNDAGGSKSFDAQKSIGINHIFLANVCHEIRSPLSVILGNAELLRCELPLAKGQEELIVAIERAGAQILRLANDILNLERLNAGRVAIEPSCFGVVAELDQAFTPLRKKAAEKGIEFVLEGDRGLLALSDAERLRQIVVNLVDNAIKFTREGSVSVRVRGVAKGEANFIEVYVADTGIGMTADEVVRVWEPFVQASSETAKKYGGNGLGLALSSGLAAALGGKLEVQKTASGAGTTFLLSLPTGLSRRTAFHTVIRRSPAGLVKATHPTRSLAGLSVLLVDDAEDNLLVVSRLLESVGVEVAKVGSGRAALRRLDSRVFDVIFLDIMMPDLDGHQVAARLRARGYRKPIVALTGSVDAEGRDVADDLLFDDYLAKPVSRERLVATIERFCPRRFRAPRTTEERRMQ